MKIAFRNTLRGLAALCLLGLLSAGLSACLHDADADSPAAGPTQAEFDALKEEVEALKSQIGRDTVFAETGGSSKAGSSALAVTDIGTFLGQVPGNKLPIVSTTGYYYFLSNARTISEQAVVYDNNMIYYDQVGCTGTPHVNPNEAETPYSAGVNGYVFRTASLSQNTSDASTYWMVQTGTTLSEFTAMSVQDPGGSGCQNINQTVFALPAVANDPEVSGVDNAPITGPLDLGSN